MLTTTPKPKDKPKTDELPPHNPDSEERIHGAVINGKSYVIMKDTSGQDTEKRFILYRYHPAPTLKDKSVITPLFEHPSFGHVAYEMFRRGGLNV